MLGELIKQTISLGVAFGLALTVEQMATLYGFVSLLGAFGVRMFVSPGGKDEGPKDPPSTGEPPTRPSGRPPLIPTAAAFLLGLAFLAPALPACSSGQTPQAQAVQAREVARAAYASGVLALTALDAVHKTWVESTKEPTGEQLAAFRTTLGFLKQAADALDEARPWVENGGGGSEIKEKILAGLDFALLGATELARGGAPVKPETVEALNALRSLLGGAS